MAYIEKVFNTDETTSETATVTNNRLDVNSRDFYISVSQGKIAGHSLIHKFGAGTLSTTMKPISLGGEYRTPQTAVSLEVVSSSASDTSNGVGARQVTIIGLNSAGVEISQTIATNGLTAVALPTPMLRVYRWFVSQSGTYASATQGSHVGNLTLRVAGAGQLWSTILNTPFPVGQSQIGAYTIPTGYTGYLLSKNVFSESSKTADIYFFKREMIGDIVTPYEGVMRLVEREVGVTGGYAITTVAPRKIGVGLCDVGFMGKVSVGTSECSVEFELLLIDNSVV